MTQTSGVSLFFYSNRIPSALLIIFYYNSYFETLFLFFVSAGGEELWLRCSLPQHEVWLGRKQRVGRILQGEVTTLKTLNQ